MDKKDREKAILSLIYDERDYAEIKGSEQPDFLIRHKESSVFFGVEITELYESKSMARLHRIPGYINEVLSNKFRDKKDKDIFHPDDYAGRSVDGTPKPRQRMMFVKRLTLEEYIQTLVDVITSKDKSNEYEKSLSHVNLVIFDLTLRTFDVPLDDFYKYFLILSLKQALYRSSFREVFLIAEIKDKNFVYFPLKHIVLFLDYCIFMESIKEYVSRNVLDTEEKAQGSDDQLFESLMLLFARYMEVKTNIPMFRRRDGRVEVVFGNTGLYPALRNNVFIDYYDYTLPDDIEKTPYNDDMSFIENPEFFECEEKIRDNFAYYIDAASQVKTSVDFLRSP